MRQLTTGGATASFSRVIDWGSGEYERTANQLWPAAELIVQRAGIQRGERVLDLGCGTGNVSLIAARAGGAVTGVDPSERLVDVARRRVTAEGLTGEFHAGDAQALTFNDGCFDVIVSVFGVIFAPQADRALSELIRVLRPGGRALVSSWLPEGTLFHAYGALGRAVAVVNGSPPPKPVFVWHDEAALRAACLGRGAGVSFESAEITFRAASPEAYVAENERFHPMAIAMRKTLEAAGTYPEARSRMLSTLTDGNEDPAAFQATSRYVIARITRLQ